MAAGGLLRFWGWFKTLKDDAILLFFAWKHPYTPAYIKGAIVALLAYVFSPVDIVPDYLPLIGIADDAMLIPAALFYLTHLLPEPVRAECQQESAKWRQRVPLLLGVLVFCFIAWIVLVIIGFSYLLSR